MSHFLMEDKSSKLKIMVKNILEKNSNLTLSEEMTYPTYPPICRTLLGVYKLSITSLLLKVLKINLF